MAYGRAARSCLGWVAVATVVACAGCGSDANLGISNTPQCGGGSGTQVRGVVRMPNGRLAAGPSSLAERLAALAVAPVDALSGAVSPVGRGVRVELAQLRPEDLASGRQPGAIAHATTNGKGEFCVALARDTSVDVCRYMLRVGDAGAGTLTRAFVHSTDGPTDIDYASEATVQVILQGIPPGDLCEYSPSEIGEIDDAVRAVPGSVGGGSAAEVNALATTMAAADATVRALVRAAGNLPPPTATNVPGSTATPTAQSTVAPSRTATHAGPTDPPTARPTRTPNGPSATPTTTRTAAATRTPTVGGATATATRPGATATATRAAATATATIPAATPTATIPAATATATVPAATPTFTATPMPGVELGERVFTIREDSMFPGDDPRVGFFSSALAGKSISDRFSPGPLVFVAGAPDANGIASLRLKQDAYFKINVPAGATVLCLRLLAAGSTGRIDCDGGTPFGVTFTEASGASAPAGTLQTGQGADSGPGAGEFRVMQSIAELNNFNAACDATVTFPTPSTSVYTTATFTVMKGTRTLAKTGESFDCATWTMTDGPGMWVNGVAAYETRAGGDSASATRLADR
ncbi:hypothetical protein KF840_10310 [bacterium]|nr:hypothetical protein [bacterium]